MMHLLLNILVIFTSLAAWIVLAVTGYILLRNRNRSKEIYLSSLIITALFLALTYNTFYEGFFLLYGISLASPVNCWFLTATIPLCYLYINYKITGNFPTKRNWAAHFAITTILFLYYIIHIKTGTYYDRITYAWSDLLYQPETWWVKFRTGCISGAIIQFIYYLNRLWINLRHSLKTKWERRSIKKEICVLSLFFFTAVGAFLTTSYLLKIIYNFFIFFIGIHFLYKPTFFKLFYLFGFQIKWLSAIYNVRKELKQLDKPFHEKDYTCNKGLSKTDEALQEIMNKSALYRNPDFNLHYLSVLLSTNETYLSRYFNQRLGTSFTEWGNRYRIDEAERLLLNEKLSIIEISEFVGFQSLSSFYQAFRNRHQMPPAQWKKNKIGQIPCL